MMSTAVHSDTFRNQHAFCENRVSAFTVSDNRQLVSSSSLIYEDVTEEVCLKMCSENRDNSGRTILCASFVYDHATFVCKIYRSRSYPESDLETEVAPGKRFFEKFCLREKVPAECANSQFLKADQSVIIGYARNVSAATSVEECIAQCLNENFQCRSVMYFYAEGECITNTESAMTQPNSYAREESDKVIYIQNGCPAVLARQKQLGSLVSSGTELPLKTIGGSDKDVIYESEAVSTVAMSEENNAEINNKSENDEARISESNVKTDSLRTEKALRQEKSRKERFDEQSLRNRQGRISKTYMGRSSSTEEEAFPEISKLHERKMTKLVFNAGSESKEEFTLEASKDNSFEENSPLEVRPSTFQIENHYGERENSGATIQGKAKAFALPQKPIKRLKIETLNALEEEDHFSQWSQWSECKKAGERSIRRRKCYNLRKCVGGLMEVMKCPKILQDVEPKYRGGHETQTIYGKEPASASSLLTQGAAGPPLRPSLTSLGLPFVINDNTGNGADIADDILFNSEQSMSSNQYKKKTSEEIWSPWPGVCQVNDSVFEISIFDQMAKSCDQLPRCG
ncbi:unnamed protein product [Thelazia callipaeda]|uniref:PAN domain protein n=1 Tax=Thelazia callipaeda TaxID=103827 RepID=A0A0N5CNH4_THECL|nr:unnamed protein product [Thelazia callipaeda]